MSKVIKTDGVCPVLIVVSQDCDLKKKSTETVKYTVY